MQGKHEYHEPGRVREYGTYSLGPRLTKYIGLPMTPAHRSANNCQLSSLQHQGNETYPRAWRPLRAWYPSTCDMNESFSLVNCTCGLLFLSSCSFACGRSNLALPSASFLHGKVPVQCHDRRYHRVTLHPAPNFRYQACTYVTIKKQKRLDSTHSFKDPT